jgi:hypothetical protein
MPSMVGHGALAELRQDLEFFAENIPTDADPALAEAVRGLLAAVDYRDSALLQSHVQAVGEAIARTADQQIEKHVRWGRMARDFCDQVRTLDGSPGKELDDLGRVVASLFDRLLGSIARLQDGWVKLAKEHGLEVTGTAALDATARDLTTLREQTLGSWPWTARGLPPVNRDMVAKSRAEIASGAGVPIQDVIRQTAGHASKG